MKHYIPDIQPGWFYEVDEKEYEKFKAVYRAFKVKTRSNESKEGKIDLRTGIRSYEHKINILH